MSASIRILEDRVIDQIAAGEVVERPASVVKELVENALDAGARAIDITLADGGRTLIRVADDGRGMDAQDALMCVERHATSKIRRVEDLDRVASFGFRGEALPSIAAVSRFEIVTRPSAAEGGTRVRMEAGKLLDVREAAAAPGTVVSIRNLFFALPARKSFLRTVGTELGHCVQTTIRMALARPDVGFTLRHGGRRVVDAPAADDPADRAADALGPDARRLIGVSGVDGDLSLNGLASPPGLHRASGGGAMYLYVNGRWVRDLVLRRAVHQAYRDLIPRGRTPIVILDVTLPGDRVDVNVHPTKAEVRFADPAGMAVFVARVLRQAIGGVAPFADRGGAVSNSAVVPLLPFRGAPPVETTIDPLPTWMPPPPPALPEAPPLEVLAAEPQTVAPLRVFAVVAGRYAVGDRGGRLWVLDAGRLSRRVQAARAIPPGRRLLAPVVVRLSEARAQHAEDAAEPLAACGLDISRFSPTEIAIRAVPGSLSDAEPADLLELALVAVDSGRGIAGHWGAGLPPPVVLDDGIAVRTLLATAEEVGVPTGVTELDPKTLLRR